MFRSTEMTLLGTLNPNSVRLISQWSPIDRFLLSGKAAEWPESITEIVGTSSATATRLGSPVVRRFAGGRWTSTSKVASAGHPDRDQVAQRRVRTAQLFVGKGVIAKHAPRHGDGAQEPGKAVSLIDLQILPGGNATLQRPIRDDLADVVARQALRFESLDQ